MTQTSFAPDESALRSVLNYTPKAQNMLISVVLIILYITLNKWNKGHSMDRFISSGLKRKTDRILFATVILICAIFAHKDLPKKSGTLLLLSCLGVALWDYSQTMHYWAAFGVAFVVAYLIIISARDAIDIVFVYMTVIVVTILVLAGIEHSLVDKTFSAFVSQCEHIAFIIAAVYFLRKTA
jgi:hypothetical protein